MLQLLWKIRVFLWSFLSKKTVGARALVIQNDQILLIKHTYLPGWCTIGGGVDQGETGLQALKRELKEEVGIELQEEPSILGFYHKNHKKWDDYIILYVCKKFIRTEAYSREISESKWFPLNNLPFDITPSTQKRIEEYLGNSPLSDTW
jgi:8-oxo-dGTP pyrophosphatase MutT (NUDIX family)